MTPESLSHVVEDTNAAGYTLPSIRLKSILPPNPVAFIVDDSVPTRRIFRMILEDLGFTVHEANNGKVALEKLELVIGEVMIIFSDISMPVLDGFEFCFRLLQESWYDRTPFILVSTESDAKNVIKGLKLGADDFLPKPFDKEIVAQVLLRIFM
ncbi:MAG: response regulator [Thermoguttaceae bacterium]